MDQIKLGFVPTRRSIFSAPDAVKYRGLTADRLREIGVDIVDIDDINDEGLLYDDSHIEPIVKKFRAEGVDGIMLCHANFGTEYVCARLARELGLPVLLWGPRDERPEPDGTRLRDSQCGLFATGKVLRRFQVPFTYMTNCRLTDPEFERGVWDFLAVCNVVKTFKHTRILQMSTRPFDFWSTMCNEGELLEKFNIQLSPIPMTELIQAVREAQADEAAMAKMLAHINESFVVEIPEDKVPAVAGLAIAMKRLVDKYGCNAGAIQCWNALQDELGIMLCHANFGTEYVCARLARELGLPVLLWGPRDERPEPDGTRLRDSQCGLFATGKVLRRFQVPFTYMTNCRLTDPEFERGVWDFLAVCNVVKTFKHTRILQMSTRPFDFWSTMCNEGELLEKFNIQLSPIPMTELIQAVREAQADEAAMAKMLAHINESFVVEIPEDKVPAVAGLAIAMKRLVDKYGCNAGAIQCWNALQDELGIMPCAANAILNEMGIPIVCETDIHGAITALMVEAADLGRHRGMFADWTMRHPDNENGELLQHCGPWPCSVACVKPRLTYPLAFDHPGALTAEAKHGELTLARFDGDNGEYSLLLGNARGIDGPAGMGTYLWVEVENLKRLEAKIVEGPYIHHCVAIHANVVPVLYEACKYIGIQPDLYDPIEEDVKAYLRGE